MRYFLLASLLFVAPVANAAYWIIDNQVSSKSHFGDLTETDKISLGGERYYDIDDSILRAKDSKLCSSKYKRFSNALRDLTDSIEIEKAIKLNEKNILVCLKKDKSVPLAVPSSTETLEKRIQTLELQISKIILALKSIGVQIQ